MNPSVYILILNWKTPQQTITCLENIHKLNYENFNVIIIDNGSNDESEEILKKKFPEHEFVQTGKNLGYAAGNNAGIRRAVAAGGEFIWILNPDVRVTPNSLKAMLNVMTIEPNVGICGPRIVQTSAPAERLIDGYSLKANGRFSISPNLVTRQTPLSPHDVDYVIGCSMLVRTKAFEEIGLFCEDFFLYWEETELCLRAQRGGWRVVVVPEAVNFHDSPLHWAAANERHHIKSSIIFSRIQRRFLVQTTVHHIKSMLKNNYLKEGMPALFEGLFDSLKQIPNLESKKI